MRITLRTVKRMVQAYVRQPVSMNGRTPTAENSVDFAVCVYIL